MTRRLLIEDETRLALWRFSPGRSTPGNRRVLIAHKDRAVGMSMSVLLRMKALETAFAEDTDRVDDLLRRWLPAVLLIDTRLDTGPHYDFARQCRADVNNGPLLLLALSNFMPMESTDDLKLAGFDGHMRRPVEAWRIADVLGTFFGHATPTLRFPN